MLKKLRERKRLSQEAVARHLGVSLGNYQRWEQKGPPKQWGQLVELARLLDCAPEEIVGEAEPGTNGRGA